MGFTRTKGRNQVCVAFSEGKPSCGLATTCEMAAALQSHGEHLPAFACTESWHSDERRQRGTNKSLLPIHSSNVVYPCGLERICVCGCLSTPFRHIKLLNASSWIWCKNVCSKVRQCKWVCVLYLTWFSLERAEPDDYAKTTSLSLVSVLWKVCHTFSMVSDIRKCLLTVGALSTSHFNICLLTQTTKKVTRVTLDHIITQKLFFSIVRNLKMVSQMHLNHLAVLWPSKSAIIQAIRNRFSQITLLLY